MSELDDLRSRNKELTRLLANALDLLEKSRLALTNQARLPARATGKKTAARRGASNTARKKVALKK